MLDKRGKSFYFFVGLMVICIIIKVVKIFIVKNMNVVINIFKKLVFNIIGVLIGFLLKKYYEVGGFMLLYLG